MSPAIRFKCMWRLLWWQGFQSTRSQGARRCTVIVMAHLGLVSIHAPARGATETIGADEAWAEVSIHAPARGATEAIAYRRRMSWFQSTRPHGARRSFRVDLGHPGEVSIHAPARGATSRIRKRILRQMFQSTRPHGARPASAARQPPERCFNPRARTGRDRARSSTTTTSGCFNPRARTGRDTADPAPSSPYQEFQSTRPHGARPPGMVQGATAGVFQSTRPHGARLACLTHVTSHGLVSIHAPARGATRGVPSSRVSEWFQSTRPHGARHRSLRRTWMRRSSFNPRARTGRDISTRKGLGGALVSIHAPARGATALVIVGIALVMFQSTRPHGARRAGPPLEDSMDSFNPRARTGRDTSNPREHNKTGNVSIHAPARGATCSPLAAALARSSFNPRARTGRDIKASQAAVRSLTVSIHAPARGATKHCRTCNSAGMVSIHAPARGATRRSQRTRRPRRRFNPRARTGRDIQTKIRPVPGLRFQSTRPHGARHRLSSSVLHHGSVSIHATARGATVAQLASCLVGRFQSTRPHGARLREAQRLDSAGRVSIHAPARGATMRRDRARQHPLVSIHAPARGATAVCRPVVSRRPCFNPRARTGRDKSWLGA